ncbi:hypothetical protein ACH4D5_34080 [Streptomyces sp. NPDC018029]|uniref:hypothetical protein n=1 Tax=Streptomyces sp. NPDC018029 TaxID=3365032 RepID=UPI0037A35C1E
MEGEWAHLAGLLSEDAPASAGEAASWPGMQFHSGRTHAEQARQPEDDPQKLFTEAVLHGLKARLCADVDSLDSYLPPQVAAMARRVAEALEVPEPAAT